MQVSIACKDANDEWSRRHEVTLEFTARKANGQFQTLHLSQTEADKVAATIVSGLSQKGREALIPGLLRDLTDAKLLRLLAADFRKRTAT